MLLNLLLATLSMTTWSLGDHEYTSSYNKLYYACVNVTCEWSGLQPWYSVCLYLNINSITVAILVRLVLWYIWSIFVVKNIRELWYGRETISFALLLFYDSLCLPVKMMIFTITSIFIVLSLPTLNANQSARVDENGYVLYCPCMGKYLLATWQHQKFNFLIFRLQYQFNAHYDYLLWFYSIGISTSNVKFKIC